MKLIFSRKGFDSAFGGGPSPIIDGVPITLPIPLGKGQSHTTYGDLGLGKHVAKASRGRLGGQDACHHDPMFLPGGSAMLGQCDGAQTHLANNGVGFGDLFLFFGLFAGAGERPHHRIFGYLEVERVIELACASVDELAVLQRSRFPHALAMLSGNDTVYCGPGRLAGHAGDALRLTAPGCSASIWQVPRWLRGVGLTYHGASSRWLVENRLKTTSPGQEFIADLAHCAEGREWAAGIVAQIEGGPVAGPKPARASRQG